MPAERFLVTMPAERQLGAAVALEDASNCGASVVQFLDAGKSEPVPTLWLFDALQSRDAAAAETIAEAWRGEMHELSTDPASCDYATLRSELSTALRLTDNVTS